MPIVSDSQNEKEQQNNSKITEVISDAMASEKKIRAKRKNNAKKFLVISALGFIASFVLYFQVSSDAGIFAAIVSSTIPAAVNLVDD